MTAETQLPLASTTAPAVLPPAADAFARRAAHFALLAPGHSLADWLEFLGRISAAQHTCLQKMSALPAVDTDSRDLARVHGMPPLPAQSLSRDPIWRAILRCLCEDLAASAPEPLRPLLAGLPHRPASEIEALADRVLRTELYGPDSAALPFVAAALQVYWTRMAMDLPTITALDVPGVCPCCGFLPVTSVIKTVGEISNLRYLHCALCNTEWNLVRVKCAACDATEGISYRQIEGPGISRPGAVRAEACDSCKSYLKIIYTEHGGGDPVAEDLASLALDMLMDEAGYTRSGPNLLFVPGS